MAADVEFVPWQRAQQLAQAEPVVFAEIVGADDGSRNLEIHVMQPYGKRLHEAQRESTESIPVSEVRARVAQVAAEHGCRYAAISRAEKDWPPEWAAVAVPQ